MTILQRDQFAGGSGSDIAGETPDVGGGTFARVTGDTGVLAIGTLGAVTGLIRKTGTGLGDARYRVTGVTLAQTCAVSVEYQCPTGFATGYVTALLGWDASAVSGYQLEMEQQTGRVSLYRMDAGTFVPLAERTLLLLTEYDAGATNTLTLYRTASGALIGFLNSLYLFTVSDTTYTAGLAGLGIVNASTGTATTVVTDWQVTDDAPGSTTGPCDDAGWVRVVAEGYDGVDDSNLDGRALDGDGDPELADGAWAEVPSSLGATTCHHQIVDNEGQFIDTGASDAWRHLVSVGLPTRTSYAVQARFHYTVAVTGTGSFTPWVAPLVEHESAEETGYEWFVNRRNGRWEFTLYAIYNGSYVPLAQAKKYEALTLDAVHSARLVVTPVVAGVSVRLCAYFDGALVCTVEDDSGFTLGGPGLCLYDPDGAGGTFAVDGWEVLAPPEDPCEGGPDNPYPWEPPPVDLPAIIRLWGVEQGRYRPVMAPGPDVQATGLSGVGGGRRRRLIRLWGVEQGRYRLIEGFEGDQFPPPDTPLPPFYDPCDRRPPVDPETVTPIPLTGRFFGMGNLPVSMLGPLFTGTTIASGYWTASDIAKCAAKGVTLVSNLGGYGRFRVGGDWSMPAYKAWVLSDLVPLLSVMQDGTIDGSFYGYSAFDDFTSANLWPPSGIPIADIEEVVDFLHTNLPDIRIGIRGLPSQFVTHPGVDFYQAQYIAWGSRWSSASDFQATEQGLAVSRGAQILLNLNYVHGGVAPPNPLSSGIEIVNGTMLSGHYAMSPAEVMAYADAIFVDGTNLAGSLGYQNNATFLAQPGIIDALAYARNVLAAL